VSGGLGLRGPVGGVQSGEVHALGGLDLGGVQDLHGQSVDTRGDRLRHRARPPRGRGLRGSRGPAGSRGLTGCLVAPVGGRGGESIGLGEELVVASEVCGEAEVAEGVGERGGGLVGRGGGGVGDGVEAGVVGAAVVPHDDVDVGGVGR